VLSAVLHGRRSIISASFRGGSSGNMVLLLYSASGGVDSAKLDAKNPLDFHLSSFRGDGYPAASKQGQTGYDPNPLAQVLLNLAMSHARYGSRSAQRKFQDDEALPPITALFVVKFDQREG
jgi:hypothetical protein